MNFSEITYSRPDLESLNENVTESLNRFEKATSASTQFEILREIAKDREHFSSMAALAHIRYTIDTNDAFYEHEEEYFLEHKPVYEGIVHKMYKALLGSRHRNELEKLTGSMLFNIAEVSVKTFDESVLAELQAENKAGNEWVKLIASAKLSFRGESHNLSSISKYDESEDPVIREEAIRIKNGFFEKHMHELDDIFDRLVKYRSTIANKLGYNSFTDLGYDRMMRFGYGREQVKQFRSAIKKWVVPATNILYDNQRKRLGLNRLTYFDRVVRFSTGNAKPKGSPDWMVGQAEKMYSQISDETGRFFNMMVDKNLMDLVQKPGKATGGYCDYLYDQKVPFIFSNFNETAHDVDVLTHEAGHAFQIWSSAGKDFPEYLWPTFEACEIHSMSMELFAFPYMDMFFKDQAAKYKFGHVDGDLKFLPYGVAIDAFQHEIYDHPSWTPSERRNSWLDIQSTYMPDITGEGMDFIEKGAFWMRQAHVFQNPFYYIDYALASVCAMQFWERDTTNHSSAWQDYLQICRIGGEMPFLDIVKAGNLRSPFLESTISRQVEHAMQYLNSIDTRGW